jgi:hypothetical protein
MTNTYNGHLAVSSAMAPHTEDILNIDGSMCLVLLTEEKNKIVHETWGCECVDDVCVLMMCLYVLYSHVEVGNFRDHFFYIL